MEFMDYAKKWIRDSRLARFLSRWRTAQACPLGAASMPGCLVRMDSLRWGAATTHTLAYPPSSDGGLHFCAGWGSAKANPAEFCGSSRVLV